jgi:hypothetical protein
MMSTNPELCHYYTGHSRDQPSSDLASDFRLLLLLRRHFFLLVLLFFLGLSARLSRSFVTGRVIIRSIYSSDSHRAFRVLAHFLFHVGFLSFLFRSSSLLVRRVALFSFNFLSLPLHSLC